jgi:hypothetical protein
LIDSPPATLIQPVVSPTLRDSFVTDVLKLTPACRRAVETCANFLHFIKAALTGAARAAGLGPGLRPAADTFRFANGVGGSSPPDGARHD